ncbi:hypothetical protein SAICODRAFT_8977 [Saitoella complicata NRRL Y-17804]|uniref:uncharacterized protein n=1 Tax=Saitoella complicata (strain BCRC 22490 / CBS 7301 / JCM 7358 / NBRC 10748 / NRRL Y-17804) TaxID=698492 RepID=UPI0008675B92|nr:uncharacterized protein SAICODRAFT_8977 [Saitoella complicata NRRL Y-17804]ODQ51322.1 hypothetical protein SAICODRAFT_8977 [Saitoella complicata NRRL Y-17804]
MASIYRKLSQYADHAVKERPEDVVQWPQHLGEEAKGAVDVEMLRTVRDDLRSGDDTESGLWKTVVIAWAAALLLELSQACDKEEVSGVRGEILEDCVTLLRPPAFFGKENWQTDDIATSLSLPFRARSIALLHLLSKSNLNTIPLYPAHTAIALATYTSTTDPWTSPSAHSIALSTLSSHPNLFETREVLIDGILLEFIKPLFTARKTRRTEAVYADSLSEDDRTPWLVDRPESLTILEWIVTRPISFNTHYHLIVPPILALLDVANPRHKLRGVRVLQEMLNRVPRDMVEKTGLGTVFWDALMLCLTYLPPMVPADVSLPLLREAFGGLRELAELRTFSVVNTEEKERKRAKVLDEVMRSGVLKGMVYAGDQVEVAEVLMTELGMLVEAMGIWSVKHLNNVIPTIRDILIHPFASTHQKSLLATLKTLQTVLQVGEPRIIGHHVDLLRGICVCWQNLADKKEGLEEVKRELRVISVKLRRVCGTVIEGDIAALVEADPVLEGLFRA